MFGLGNIFKNIGGSFLNRIASKVFKEVPILNKIANAALKIVDGLPLMKIRNWVKNKIGIDIKDLLKLTPAAPVATVMEARDALAAAVGKNGAPEKGSAEWSGWFNTARVAAFDQYKKQLSAAA
jgi:hypothetical protein